MKYARALGVTAVAIVLGVFVFFPSRQASGQVGAQETGASAPALTSPNLPTMDMGGGFAPSADPKLAKLLGEESTAEREAVALVKKYSGTENEEDRAKFKSKLADVLGKQFDLQQKRRDLELTRLEAQVKKLRELMKKRSEARTTIVEKRLDQLLREADGLGWTPPPGLRNPYFPNNHTQALPAGLRDR